MTKHAMRSRRISEGHIYLIRASNGYVKIGSTGGNPYERFTMAACYSPLPVTIPYICKCSHPVDVEEAVHRLLDAHRQHREWFDLPVDQAVGAIRTVLAARGYLVAKTEGRTQAPRGTRMLYAADLNEIAMRL